MLDLLQQRFVVVVFNHAAVIEHRSGL